MNITDKEIIYQAINMWQNYIQTNDVTLSSIDVRNAYGDKLYEGVKINKLSIEQMEFIVRLDKLKNKFL